MSNPQTYYITMNGSGQFQDLSGIFQPLSLGTSYPTATGFKLSDGRDLNQIFANISSGSALGYNVNFNSVAAGNLDLSQIFAKYGTNAIYTINNQSNMNVTTINYGGYTALIFENTTSPNYLNATATNATCTITFNTVKNVIILVVGGGAGGAGGYNTGTATSSGAGGGAGGAGYVKTNFNTAIGSAYFIQVGGGGPGRKVTNAGAGQEAGYSGGTSSFILGGLTLYGYSGQAGYNGYFSVGGISGGQGGNAINVGSLNTQGGGGGGGGGGANDTAYPTNGGPFANPTSALLNTSIHPGNVGSNGGTSTTGNGGNGGNGGNAYVNYIDPPFLSSGLIFYGNGGGGGSYNNGGGQAGFTTGGTGFSSGFSGSSSNGQDAVYGFSDGNYYYGNGGGGGATVNSPDNYGGNGGNGVVMLWWLN